MTPTTMTRPQLAGRITALRAVLDILWCQTEADGHPPFAAIGAGKVELIRLEQALRDMDLAAAKAFDALLLHARAS